MPMFLSMFVLVALSTSTEPSCKATPEMAAFAQSMGYSLGRELSGGIGARRPRSAVCADVDADGAEDFCTILESKNSGWEAGCFITWGGRVRFEEFETSQTRENKAPVAPEAFSLSVVSKGRKVEWGNGAAEISLLRDCIEFGVAESGATMYCYNGGLFLGMVMGD